MAESFYSRRSLHVEVYGLLWSQLAVVAGDVEFFLELAKSAPGPTLELGCGSGRIVMPLAEGGIEITGLDLSAPMLEIASERAERLPREAQGRVSFVEGDMSVFDLGREFGLIYIAFRSFMFMTTPEMQRACLECAYRHLVPGGTLAIDIFDPLLERLVPDYEIPMRHVGMLPHPRTFNRVGIDILSRVNDPVTQVFEETWRFTEAASDGTIIRQEEEMLRMRWTYRTEMRYLLERAGFEVLAEYSDFYKSPPAYGKEQVWVARKPER